MDFSIGLLSYIIYFIKDSLHVPNRVHITISGNGTTYKNMVPIIKISSSYVPLFSSPASCYFCCGPTSNISNLISDIASLQIFSH